MVCNLKLKYSKIICFYYLFNITPTTTLSQKCDFPENSSKWVNFSESYKKNSDFENGKNVRAEFRILKNVINLLRHIGFFYDILLFICKFVAGSFKKFIIVNFDP